MNRIYTLIISTVLLIALTGFTYRQLDDKKNDISELELLEEAYIYGLPLVINDLTRLQSERKPNSLHHLRQFPDHTFRQVVRPNNDTYYSLSFIDLGSDALVFEVPDTRGRYAVFPFSDAWTNVVYSLGKRTTGTQAQKYLLTGPNWKGEVPEGLKELKFPTENVWFIGRIQVNSPKDGREVVVPLQDQIKLTSLKVFNGETAVEDQHKTYSVEALDVVKQLKKKEITVVEAIHQIPAEDFFNYLNELLIKNPPLQQDKALIAKLAKLNIGAGKKFRISVFDAEIQKNINEIPGNFPELFKDLSKQTAATDSIGNSGGKVGDYGSDYLSRAFIAYRGLGALPPQDAKYLSCLTDQNGNPLEGNNRYVVHFEKGKTPPARAFWSYTVYDKDGFLAENPIKRYAIGDRDDLIYNEDGSLNIYLQKEAPVGDKIRNWLPVPAGSFNISVRIYWPAEEFLNNSNSWNKPEIVKL